MSFLGIPERELSCTNIFYNPQGREVNTMKQETIMKAVKVINRSIKFYQRKLTYQLELRAEATFDNGNLKVDSFGNYESNIKKYEIILADLATIKRAIKNNQTSVKLWGSAENMSYIYWETCEALKEAGFDFGEGDEFGGAIELIPIDDTKEKFLMRINELMSECEN